MQTAQKYFEESLSLKQQQGDQFGIAISQYDMGHLYHKLGNLQMAENLFKESIAVLKRLGEQRHQANAQWYYALLQVDRGDLDTAKTLLLKDVLPIEKLLQREQRIERTEAKLGEVEKAIAARQSIHKVEKLPAVQTTSNMNNIVLSAKAMSSLVAYVSMSMDQFIHQLNIPYEKAKAIFSLLKERWTGDEVATSFLSYFTDEPEIYKLALENFLQKRLAKDSDLATQLSQLLEEEEQTQ